MNSIFNKTKMLPIKALIVYKSSERREDFDVKIFDINNKCQISTERPFTVNLVSKLTDFFNTLESEEINSRFGMIPENLIFLNKSKLIWKKEPCEKMLYFNNPKITSQKVQIPRIVFAYDTNKLNVFIVKDKKIDEETKLFKAPFMNVNDKGVVCMGNTKINTNRLSLREIIQDIELNFFNSYFTEEHSNEIIKGNLIQFIKSNKKLPKTKYILSPIKKIKNLII